MEQKFKNLIIVADLPYIDGGSHKVAIETALLLQNNFKVFYFSCGMEHGKTIDPGLANSNVTVITGNYQTMKSSGYSISSMFSAVYNFKAGKKFSSFLAAFNPTDTLIMFHTWGRIASSSVINSARKKRFPAILVMHDYLQVCPSGALFNYSTTRACSIKPFSIKCFFCNCIEEQKWIIKAGKFARGVIQTAVLKRYKLLKYAYPTDFSYDVTQRRCKFINSSNTVYLPNPINVKCSPTRTECEKNNVYVFIGNLSVPKGVDLFCEACTSLNLISVIIGEGARLNELRERYPKSTFTGFLPKERISIILERARAVVFPSLYFEVQGLSAVEALQSGVPVVFSDTCAVSGFVKDRIEGFSFTCGNVESLKEKLTLLKDSKVVKDLSINSYEKGKSLSKELENYTSFFYSAINNL